jgi:plasmid stabilization system protein ParE
MGKKEKAVTKASQVRILNEAFHDIDQITDFIANNNQQPLNAVKVTEAIFETINKIGQNPLAYNVVWGGIEPPTQGFSDLCSTD